MGTLPSSVQDGTGSWKPSASSSEASGAGLLPWGKTTPLPQHLINCSACSALLSMREWLAWVQTHLINFAIPLGTSHISLP